MVQFGPPPGHHWMPLPEFTDEFDGDALDTTKWHPTNPDWLGRAPGFFTPRNVSVVDGCLHITMKYQPDFSGFPDGQEYRDFTTGAVKSRKTVLYGYFEVRARAMDSHGSSAFWFYDSLPDWWTEIDVFEIGGGAPGFENKCFMTVHVMRTPEGEKEHWQKGEVWDAPFRFADDFHVFGLYWSKERIEWYVDGELRWSIENTHWHQPLYMNFDSETMPDWFGLPVPEELPSTFSIDYVRSWQER